MKHTKKTRLLAGILAALIVAVPGAVHSSGQETDDSSGGSASDSYETPSLAELLSTIDYTDYLDRYHTILAATPLPTQSAVLTGEDIVSKMDAAITNAKDVTGCTLADGTRVLYLPSEGTVGWTIEVPAEGMYNLKITYYPVQVLSTDSGNEQSKTTSIERTLYINGHLPFYEARFLTLTKSWVDVESSYQLDTQNRVVYKFMKDGKVKYPYVDQDGNCLELDFVDKRRTLVETGDSVNIDQLIADGYEKYPVYNNDINRNEIKPDKTIAALSAETYAVPGQNVEIRSGERSDYIASDSTGQHIDALELYFTKGENTIQLEAQREAMMIAKIELCPASKVISYEDYLAQHSDAKDYSGGEIKVQAEYPAATSENTIYATNDRTSYITEPQDASQLLLNAIGGDGGEKWKNVGQWVRWNLEVPETGWYQITLRFKQSVLEGTFSSRTLRVATAGMIERGEDAAIPFDEAQYLQFNYSDDWQVAALNNGSTTFKIYLEKGVNQIELEASLGNMADILKRVQESMTTVNAIYIKILMITGASPDANNDYGFYRIMPDDIDELLRQADELNGISEAFTEMMQTTGSHAKTLNKIALLLERMGSNEDKIASNLTNLKDNLGTLGTWIQTSTEQPLEIDYIVAEAPGTDVEKAHRDNDNFWQSLVFEVVQFARSFVSDYNTLGSMELVDEDDTIQVWTTLGRDQAMIIRNLINSDFNAHYPGVSVELKLVAGGSLLPSVLAGVGPDVSMGHGSGDVINWAIRSAVMPLNTMDGIEEVVGKFDETEGYLGGTFAADGSFSGGYFTKAAIEPLELFGEFQDGTSNVTLYGIPETQSFSMMFYRADVFQNLGIEAPQTWDDLIAILPILQTNHMDVAMPNSLAGLNLFNYQMGGDLYADNGKRVSLDEDITLQAFDYMCSFFSKYKCPTQYDFANRFRTGEMPIGIMDYTSFTQLSVYATEIRGLWEFVPLPGWATYENGSMKVNNSSVSGTSALIMLYNDDRKFDEETQTWDEKTQNAWTYMKWYVGADNQSAYANELTSLLGTVSKHNTANVQALSSLSWTTSEYRNLMSQFTNLSAVREYPGGYIITRYVSFAFLAVYNNNADPPTSLLSYVNEINKEITRKRKEFEMTYLDTTSSSDSADGESSGD